MISIKTLVKLLRNLQFVQISCEIPIYQGHWRWLWRREVTRLSETLPQLRSSSPKDPIKKTWFMGYPIISTNTNKNNYWDIHWYNGYLPIIYTMGYPKWQFSGSTFRRTSQFCRLVRSKTIQPTQTLMVAAIDGVLVDQPATTYT